MQKLILAIALLFTSLGKAIDVPVELKAANFYSLDSNFQNIYGGTGLYGMEVSCQAWKDLYGFASSDIFFKRGHSVGLDTKTSILFIPIGFGMKYFFPKEVVDLYVGLGGVAGYVHMKDHSSYVESSRTNWGMGGVAKTGLLYKFGKVGFFNFFADYTYLKIDIGKSKENIITYSADLSHLSFGVGIGYRLGATSNQ